MKIGFFLYYPQDFWSPGGGVTDLLNLYKAFKELRHDVEYFNIWKFGRRNRYDILQVIGSSSQYSEFVVTAKNAGERVVVKPIALSFYPNLFWRNWRRIAKILPVDTVFTYRKRIYDHCDLMITQSRFEANQLAKNYDISRKKMVIIPNGVEERFLRAEPDLFVQKYGIKDFVLMVGRICKNKGQLRLLKALRESQYPIVFIGPSSLDEFQYFEKFKKCVQKQSGQYLGYIPYDSPLLPSAYAAAKVVALISLAETFGNVCLEAAAAGANVVIDRDLPIAEYFGHLVFYCNTRNSKSIKNAVQEAYLAPRTRELREYVNAHLTWEQIAGKYLDAYKGVLSCS